MSSSQKEAPDRDAFPEISVLLDLLYLMDEEEDW